MRKSSKLILKHAKNDVGRILGEYEGDWGAVNSAADESLTAAEVQTLVTIRELLDRFEEESA